MSNSTTQTAVPTVSYANLTTLTGINADDITTLDDAREALVAQAAVIRELAEYLLVQETVLGWVKKDRTGSLPNREELIGMIKESQREFDVQSLIAAEKLALEDIRAKVAQEKAAVDEKIKTIRERIAREQERADEKIKSLSAKVAKADAAKAAREAAKAAKDAKAAAKAEATPDKTAETETVPPVVISVDLDKTPAPETPAPTGKEFIPPTVKAAKKAQERAKATAEKNPNKAPKAKPVAETV